VSASADRPAPGPRHAGLCDRCEHQQLVANTRGSTFSLCRLSRVDAAFARYPRLPVAACDGFAAREDARREDAPRASS